MAVSTKADELRSKSIRLISKFDPDKYKEELQKLDKNPTPTQDLFEKYGVLQLENVNIRSVDNFLSYLSEIIQGAIRRQPKILMSEETVKVEDILRFSRYSDLVSYLVDKKINELSYSSISDVEKFVRKRTGISMFETDEERTLLIFSIELRNIYTHNRGLVSEITLRKMSGLNHNWNLTKGKWFSTDFEEMSILANNLLVVARRIDHSFSKKFSIKRKRYNIHDDAVEFY